MTCRKSATGEKPSSLHRALTIWLSSNLQKRLVFLSSVSSDEGRAPLQLLWHSSKAHPRSRPHFIGRESRPFWSCLLSTAALDSLHPRHTYTIKYILVTGPSSFLCASCRIPVHSHRIRSVRKPSGLLEEEPSSGDGPCVRQGARHCLHAHLPAAAPVRRGRSHRDALPKWQTGGQLEFGLCCLILRVLWLDRVLDSLSLCGT